MSQIDEKALPKSTTSVSYLTLFPAPNRRLLSQFSSSAANLKGLEKGSILRHMTSVIQPILEKGIVYHSIIHRLLMEYFSIADKVLLYPFPVKSACFVSGPINLVVVMPILVSKERKKIIKGMKGYIDKIAYHQHGCMNGRRPLIQLLNPNCSRYFSLDDLAPLNSYIPSLSVKVNYNSEVSSQTETSKVEEPGDDEPGDDEPKEDIEVTTVEANKDGDNSHLVESGKKDPIVRRQELLIKSGLVEVGYPCTTPNIHPFVFHLCFIRFFLLP
ncbi:pumilio-like protein 24-like [Senna tora]|uniref:Pumilio-like protein 24-like n=1 Tax=Senna tora TaxID=362788 RepID=A0A834SD64_9FABA|nr:pumilio-like protein 24-like [Senna tora]